MKFDLWLKDKFPDTTKFDAADMEAAWDAALSHCLTAVDSCRSLTPAVDGLLSPAELHDWRCAVEMTVNVARTRIERPDVDKLLNELTRLT